MGIFGEQGGGFGSLGDGAPDTGRGDAFDELAASRGYGPLTPGGTRVQMNQPRPRPIPPGGFANVRLNNPRGVPIPPGVPVDVTAMQGMGAVNRSRTIPRPAPTSRFRLTNGFSVTLTVEVIERATGAVHATVTIPPRNQVDVPVVPRRLYGFRYTASFTKDMRNLGLGVSSGQTRTVTLSA